jgi:hypothetical protein
VSLLYFFDLTLLLWPWLILLLPSQVMTIYHPNDSDDAELLASNNQTTKAKRPFPNVENIRRHLVQHFVSRPAEPAAEKGAGALYDIQQQFAGLQPWIKHMDRLQTASILYRHDVTDHLFETVVTALQRGPGTGIIIKGPHGIGKSHSLINLVLKLQSTGDYLVTFVPNCGLWHSGIFLMRMICNSFGATIENVGFPSYGPDDKDIQEEAITVVKDAIDAVLFSLGKQWVFIFDQINEIFKTGPDEYDDSRNHSFPFYMMRNVLREQQN